MKRDEHWREMDAYNYYRERCGKASITPSAARFREIYDLAKTDEENKAAIREAVPVPESSKKRRRLPGVSTTERPTTKEERRGLRRWLKRSLQLRIDRGEAGKP